MGKKSIKKLTELRSKFKDKNKETMDPLKLVPFLKEYCLNKKYKRNFDQSVDMVFHLNLKGQYSIKSGVVLPNLKKNKDVKILVLSKGISLDEAKSAGADYFGLSEYITKIMNGWLDFNVVLATPDVMKDVARLGPVLGRKGLMPNPKYGTVGIKVKDMISEFKKGKKLYQADKNGILSLNIGYVSMDDSNICENIRYMYDEVLSKKPSDLKGEYIKSIYIGATMTPSLKVSFN